MNTCVIIVDNSNVWIEGKKFSAKQKNITGGDDPSWRIDFGRLLSTVAEGKEIKEAILVGSRPPMSDSVWNAAKERGFKVKVHPRNSVGKEKAVDTELVAQGVAQIYTFEPGTLKILSGDRDFIPLVRIAPEQGWETEMWAFTNAFSKNGDMAQSVTRICPLDNVFDQIGRNDFVWPNEAIQNVG